MSNLSDLTLDKILIVKKRIYTDILKILEENKINSNKLIINGGSIKMLGDIEIKVNRVNNKHILNRIELLQHNQMSLKEALNNSMTRINK